MLQWYLSKRSTTNKKIDSWHLMHDLHCLKDFNFSDLYLQEGLDLLLNLTLVDSDYSYCFKALIMFLVIAVISTSVLSNEFSRILFLNGDNFSDWKGKILLTLGCMDLDLALRVDEPLEPMDESSATEKGVYDKWERSNRLSLMLIKSHISHSIRGSIPPSDKVKNYMRAIEEQFVSSDKAFASTVP
ncbi:uncharacterized protein LOC114260357 [Camellia sinensis]|uniref:uncharacterized protein LOC114260357 n=1 Tax=Camellia sinensis TaxID=4442 RepID=UPI0010355714|nr:uncharacterized protein LOC114260357 [Camellia sinensis]